MTYSMIVGKYKLIFSDTHFKDFRKKPTISVYDADTNSETKIASFNSQETFEWFIEAVVKADRKTENNSEKPNNCEELNAYRECVKSRSFWDSKHCDGCYFDERCPFDEPKDEPQIGEMMTEEEFDSMLARVLTGNNEPQTDCAWK